MKLIGIIGAGVLILCGTTLAAGEKPSSQKSGWVDPNPGFTESNCPKCGTKQHVIPIVYGLPDDELMEQSKRGEVALGGCVMDEKNPHWLCKSCKTEW